MLGLVGLAAAFAVAACAPLLPAVGPRGAVPDDLHIPPYARWPYQPFSRNAAVQIALREWRAFGAPVVSAGEELPYDAERAPGLWQRVGDYWWQGLAMGSPDQGITGKHNNNGFVFPASQDASYAWSAVFIDYVMRMAGAGHRFPYSPLHADYINAAEEEALGERHDLAIVAEPPQRLAPRPGDLVCMWRGSRPVGYADLPAGRFLSHCDIVVATHPGSIDGIGGNVDNTVAMRHIPTTANGCLAAPDGRVVDPNHPWFVVLRVNYDDDGPIVSPFTPTPVS
jgi:Uncharacterized protein conserved in bacteria (DUF2272)